MATHAKGGNYELSRGVKKYVQISDQICESKKLKVDKKRRTLTIK
jgi:hypothetical protein